MLEAHYDINHTILTYRWVPFQWDPPVYERGVVDVPLAVFNYNMGLVHARIVLWVGISLVEFRSLVLIKHIYVHIFRLINTIISIFTFMGSWPCLKVVFFIRALGARPHGGALGLSNTTHSRGIHG